jgi:fructose-1,6-bisphosphatase/inositol monophosphatase family enzyme
MFLAALRDIGVVAAYRAGEIQMQSFGKQVTVIEHKRHDLKLAIDRRSERVILDTISERFPDHGFISEECGIIQGSSDYYWILDPLDGSVNYNHGMPCFAVSIACYQKHSDGLPIQNALYTPVVGVVYLPFYQDLYEAVEGNPALKNKEPISTGTEAKLSEAIIALSFGSDEITMQHMERINTELLRKVRKIRIHGATASDLVNVAEGRCSGLVQRSVKIWDFAAAALILKQAGGSFAAKRIDRAKWQIVAAASGIMKELSEMLDDTPCQANPFRVDFSVETDFARPDQMKK